MKKLLTVPLAAAALCLAGTAVASADTSVNHYCTGPTVVAPDISATTCVNLEASDAVYAFGDITITNNSPYPVTISVDLITNSGTLVGSSWTCVPRTTTTCNNGVGPLRSPSGRLTARGHLEAAGWSTYTYSSVG